MKVIVLSASVIFGFLVSGTVSANPHEANESRFPISIAEAEQRHAQRIAKIDTNGDNVIDPAEFEATELRGGRRDFKNRGKRGEGQRSKFGRRGHPARQAAHSEAVQAEVFNILDQNGDGSISADEFNSADRKSTHQLARKRAMFKRLDADGDGLLKQTEMPDPAERLRNADADGNGEVTAQEFRTQMRHKFREHRQRNG